MDEGNPLASCLGGWDMLINAQSDMQEEAWEFIKFMTSPEQMKFRAVKLRYYRPGATS